MTNEEIEIIKIVFQSYLNIVRIFGGADCISEKVVTEVRDKLIKELEQQRWIPVSERLPMNGDACCDDDVLVSCEDGSVKIGFCMGYDELGNREWCISADKYVEVAAWMPLPERYEEEQDGK